MKTDALKKEISALRPHGTFSRNYWKYTGYAAHMTAPAPLARAYAIEALFTRSAKYIYENDRIAGSLYGLFSDDIPSHAPARADRLVASFGERNFTTNYDHFAPDYETLLTVGVGGILKKIDASLAVLDASASDFIKKSHFLQAARLSMEAFSVLIGQYAQAAEEKAQICPANRRELLAVADTCRAIRKDPPASFRQALQLVWLAHCAFVLEGRFAMALGRLDQYLFPFYEKDRASGILHHEEAVDLLAAALYKIGEWRRLFGGDDVVNICIGGLNRQGDSAVNELSFCILEAVGYCNIPGPNLSARIGATTPNAFLEACLGVIGTGLGYPALMNDEVNIPALHRMGYALEDCRNYCMVGCIENFLPGQQPPWSDGRFNVPKFLELALNDGRCMLTGEQLAPPTGTAESFGSMNDFMQAFYRQLDTASENYAVHFNNENNRYNPYTYMSPFLSCFCKDCISRGLDVNDGGALYPSAHGACGVGIGSVADALAAVEWAVFDKKIISMADLQKALLADFSGFEALQAQLLSTPKYGNNDDYADKYAVWYVETLAALFDRFRTRDGGRFYIAIASNVQNISAGREVAALPDGRNARQPLSDAASPTYGRDKKGPTAVLLSMAKPDYTLAACGTVLNQKFSPDMFRSHEKKKALAVLIRTYFAKGGQEIQINAVSREVLKKAIEKPVDYPSLVVRVSGFSAYYTTLDASVQQDILHRTEHGEGI